MIFLISDTHFGHKILVERQLREVGFEYSIIKEWQKVVNEDDTVIHLGDFALGRFGEHSLSKSVKHWSDMLSGRKILVRGNHDKQSSTWYISNGFILCVDSMSLKFNGSNIYFSHEPQKDFIGDLNVHGHLHGNKHKLDGKLEGYPWGDASRYLDISNHKIFGIKPLLIAEVIN